MLAACTMLAACPVVDETALDARLDLDGDGDRATTFGGTDCDDGDPAVGAGGDELWYDGIDQNCDGRSDFDKDDDGWDWDESGAGDCDDEDPTVHPEATEACDGIDQDCALDSTGEADADGDGWRECAGDCDDGDPNVNPAAVERCDPAEADEDCDGLADDNDERPENPTLWYPDEDDDGYGDPAGEWESCIRPAGFTENAEDCDDADPDLNPQTIWHPDVDADGWGDALASIRQCLAPESAVRDGTDCDDSSAEVNPAALERCNEMDDDCDQFVDAADDSIDPAEAVWYRDADRDGVGNTAFQAVSCAESGTYVHVAGDCDDEDDSAYPGGTEACDAVDNDCDSLIDDADADVVGQQWWYLDIDGDEWGENTPVSLGCFAPDDAVDRPGDCDDADPIVYPGAVEVCDQRDEDCDGFTDDDDPDVVGQSLWYADLDGDLWGDSSVALLACDAPVGFVGADRDCDDADSGVNPGTNETCASAGDDDCDGVNNGDDAIGCAVLYQDEDSDGFGAGSARCLCEMTDSWRAPVAGDCEDTNAFVHPDAIETCETTADDDCNGLADVIDAAGCTPWYFDGDGDGHGVDASECHCEAAGQYSSSLVDDCDDTLQSTWPGAPTTCLDGVDQDCDDAADACSLSAAAASISGEADGDAPGIELRDGADFDDDGIPDFLMGTSYESGGGGALYIVSGATRGSASLSGSIAKFVGPEGGGGGAMIASLGDVDGDGESDVLFGANTANERAYEGAAYLFLGPFVGTFGAPGADGTLIGEMNNDNAGYDVAAAGDINGDGLADMLVGSPGADWPRPSGGAVSLVSGPATGTVDLSFPAAAIWGAAASDYLGYAQAGLGDVDGDGTDDIAVGTPYADPGGASTGAVYVLRGPIIGFASVTSFADATIEGATGLTVGSTVAAVGDLDNDGLADVGTCAGGVVTLYAGNTSGKVASSAAMVRVQGANWLHSFDDAGDVNGDGAADLVVGAAGEDTVATNAGVVYVVLGAFASVIDPAWSDSALLGVRENDAAGYSVSGIGDVNLDGLADVAVGAPDASRTSSGYIFMWFGGG